MSAEPASAAELQPGQVFEGKYKILRELGRGGFGMVYLAFQEGMDRHVALKILKSSVTRQAPSAKERFLREVKIISRLKHPNTVTIHDFGETYDGGLYMVLEYVEGETLKQVLKREGAQDPLRAADLARQIARSLGEAHRHGIVHRDLKPANIMITSVEADKDFVKVLDFGVARLLDPKTDDLTSVGLPEGERELIGTPRYMSPEQVRGESLTGASDIYGLGLMLYEMLCGEPAVQGDTTMGLITQQISPEPLRLNHLHSFTPPLQDIIRIATSKQLSDRFQTAEQMAEALETIIFQLRRDRNLTGPQSADIPLSSYQSQLAQQQPPWLQHGSGFHPQPNASGSWGQGQQPYHSGQFAHPGQVPAHQPGSMVSGFNPHGTQGPFQSGMVPGPPAPQPTFNSGFNEIELPDDDDFKPTIERDMLDRDVLRKAAEARKSATGLSIDDLPPVPRDERPFGTAPEKVVADEPPPPVTSEPDLARSATSASVSRVRTRPPAQDEGLLEFSVAVIKVCALATLTVITSYVFFLVLGAWLDAFLSGTARLVVSAVGALTIPLAMMAVEGSGNERFRVVARLTDRISSVCLKSLVIAIFSIVVLCAIFAGKIVPALQSEPNWFLSDPDSPGFATFNRKISYGVADVVGQSMGAIGLYDKKAPAAVRDNAPPTGQRRVLPRPTRTHAQPSQETRSERDSSDAPARSSGSKGSKYVDW